MTVTSWKPRLIALDVDGTLLDPETQTISSAVKAAVRRAADSGCQVVVATGRSVLGTQSVLRELSLTSGTALCSNGAVTVDVTTAEVLSVRTFEPGPAHQRLSALLPGAVFAAERVGMGTLVTSAFHEHTLHGPQKLVTVEELTGEPVPRMIASWVGHEPSEVAAALDGVGLPTGTYTMDHYTPSVTVVPEGVSKGATLEKLRAELGIAPEDTFAAGDGDNDIQMIEWAAHGVAMGQAPAFVHAAADEVTGPVSADGLASALERWFAEDR